MSHGVATQTSRRDDPGLLELGVVERREAPPSALFHSETELRTWIAYQATPACQPVAGYDLVFTPVKSVSVLWALADHEVAKTVEDAHHAAVARALAFVESHAALTRTGAGGVSQVDTHCLLVAMFDHRDSRTGDPNLHTRPGFPT